MMSVTPSSFKIPHVFLSFRGEDTRKNFTDHLYAALKRDGILIFPDDEELPRGEDISTVLLSAIRGSRISIVVFSKGYASSSWCLDELVEIVRRRNTPGPSHTLLPIFYHVDPSDVRYQTGTVAEAFSRHEKLFQTDMERVQSWRASLTEATNSPGLVLMDVANGSKEIHKIVEEVSDVVHDCLNGPRYSMRMDSCVKKITDLLNLGTSDIRIVGMSWMDGIVKKTLTEVVYNQICDGFEVSSFILDIRAISRVPNGLVHLQEQLLCDILKMKNFNINNVDEGINLIEETIQGKRVLFVLDDVDHFKQLHALVGNFKCFGPGSRVIATSRDEQLRTELEAHGKYKVEDLRYWKSLQLFSWHASTMAHPAEDFSIEMLLDQCLPGHDYMVKFNPNVTVPVCVNLDLSGEGSEKQITSEPEEVVFDVEVAQITSNFSEEMKFEIEEVEIEPEAVDIDQHVSDTIIQPKEVLMQGGLGLLIEPPKDEDWKNVKEIYLMHNELSGLSGNPRHPMPLAPFLHKHHKLATSFDALQILDLSKTGIRSLPESIVRLVNLKRLILSYCHCFMRLSPKVGELKQLEVLDLEGTEITDLPENLRCPKLLELFLHKNHKLRTIPPSFFDYMPALQVLNLSRTGIRSLPESIVRLVSLKSLFLSYCHHLERLSPKVGELNQLEVLDLEGTEIKDLPENLRFFMLLAPFFQTDNKLRTIPFSSFDAIQILNLSRTGIRSLPESIVRLINLERLILSYCHRLRRLSPKVGELKQLEVLDLEGTEIMDFPEEIKKLINLTCLKFSFYGYMDDGSSAMQSDAVVPCGVISTLSHLEELMISVNPNDKQWNACVEDIVKEVCTLESLNTLLFYFPKVELVKHFLLNSPVWVYQSLSHFRFIVGDHVKRIISRLPRDVEPELERWERCLKYINGVAIPTEIKEVLQYSTAFFLERHAIVKKLSDFGIENMKQLKCCVVGECNDVEVIIDEAVDHEEDSEADAHEEDDEANAHEEEADAHEEDDEVEAYREDGSSEMVSKTSGAEKIVLGSLEYLCIYYMKNLRTIWKGPVQPKCLSLLKSLTLRTCPQLTTIFTRGLLENLYNLEELTIEDCPSIKTLVSFEVSAEHKTSHFLPNLKWISLHYMPKLDTISSGLHIAPRLEWLSFYNCPNLKNPLIEEVSSKDLKKIEGERSWWEALEWRSGRPAYLDDIFVPINVWDC